MSRPCDNCGADIKVCFDCDLYKGKLVEQKAGKWVEDQGDGFTFVYCSECKKEPICWNLTAYCPHCGAKMEVEDAD